jgi:hypothetical protein
MSETLNGNTNLSSTNGFTNNLGTWSVSGGDPNKNGLSAITHNFSSPDVLSTVGSAPTTSNVNNPGLGVVPPNVGQPISVSGAAGSTGNPSVDISRKVAGQVPGTSVVVNLPG